ncbi:amidase family protein (plasmid) [Streptomyces sp. NBC_00536]|uniref:amidase family protein n=1 Tax=Streptomyces sp. NBC_00536 TaxID=2975769 RepID=UPI002E801F03|nr:amidase family protein [Streptomyces sp. NBC_00536]WUC84398.1 amidase family protein [Streptomyces sp. NBC_00536]
MSRRTLLAASAAVTGALGLARPAAAAEGESLTTAASTSALHLAPAYQQVAALRARQISARTLLERLLAHHAKVNPALNAVVTLDADAARAAADRADQYLAQTGRTLGPLHGLPITVKDALEVKGMRTTSGSPDFSNHVPATDADAVALLRAAGAVIIGKTNVPTMCQDIQTSNPIFGKTKNPFADDRTAGGSSGGPAAAVATGLSSIEVGSDLGGSLRLPAAYCGVYALRTSRGASPIVSTRGHIPRLPGWATSSDMLTLGPIARTPADLDLLLGVLAAPAPADGAAWKIELPAPTKTCLSQYRVGIWADDAFCRVDGATRALLDQVLNAVRQAGAQVDASTRPVNFGDSDKLFQRLMYATASATAPDAAFAADIEAADKIPAGDPSGLFLHSRTMRHRDWLVADETRQKLRAAWADYFTQHDILITPAAPTAAVLDQTSVPVPQRFITVDGAKRGYFEQTAWITLASPVGLPSIVVPVGQSAEGLPMSIQIIGPYLSDRTLIAVAKLLAQVLPAAPKAPALTA